MRLSRCVIWDNAYIKKGARISDSVICSNVRIGQGCTLEDGVIVAADTSIGDESGTPPDDPQPARPPRRTSTDKRSPKTDRRERIPACICPLPSIGIETSIVAPSPGRLRTLSVPPARRTRSLIPISPSPFVD